MNTDLDLLTPVEGVAALICRGFSMRQIAALLALRARISRPRHGKVHRRRRSAASPAVSRCLRRKHGELAWRIF